MNEIVKYQELYKVLFKDENIDDIIITIEVYKLIKEDIKNNKWVEIMNSNEYSGNGSILFPKGIQLGDRISTGIRPVLGPNIKDEGHQEILRIVIIGELISDGKKTGISAGAYTDVFVNP